MGMGRGEIKEKKRKEGRTKTKEGKGMKVTRTVLCRLLLRLIWEGMWVVYDILFFLFSLRFYYYCTIIIISDGDQLRRCTRISEYVIRIGDIVL